MSRKQRNKSSSRKRRARRIFRMVSTFQLLGVLTCSFVGTTFWLMTRFESSYIACINEMQGVGPLRKFKRQYGNRSSQQSPSSERKEQLRRNEFKPQGVSNLSTAPTPMHLSPLASSLEYLGVLIDAGRHFFPLPWLYEQLGYLHAMGYNYIHFRLTDDQNFILNLTVPSDDFGIDRTSLAFVARREQEKRNSNRETVYYQPEELLEFVRFAKNTYNITVIPEINVPGHVGAWGANAVFSDLVVPCPEFVCIKGYGIPFNLTHPLLPRILQTVLSQVVEIFDRPPFLHLGGDELHMSLPCLEEAGIEDRSSWLNKSVATFEEDVLGPIVEGLGYGPHQILRWETKDQQKQQEDPTHVPVHRFGRITQYWESIPSNVDHPYVVSTRLYLDVTGNGRVYGYGDFQAAQKLVSDLRTAPPFAIVAGAFELGTEFWEDRNVLGRLLAIRMGLTSTGNESSLSKAARGPKSMATRNEDSSSKVIDGSLRTQQDFRKQYIQTCNSVFNNHNTSKFGPMCSSVGWPLLDDHRYQAKWKSVWKEWKDGLCGGLTIPVETLHIEPLEVDRILLRTANSYFWNSKMSSPDESSGDATREDPNLTLKVASKTNTRIPKVGVIVDLVQASISHQEYRKLLQMMEHLGMNLIQLRLSSDVGQAVEYDSIRKTVYRFVSLKQNQTNSPIYNKHQLKQMVDLARSTGIQSVPEINLATNGGGWSKTGILVDCPRVLCEKGRGVAFDVIQKMKNIMPITLGPIEELQKVFSSSSGDDEFLLHLGSDERVLAAGSCFAEAGYNESEALSALHRFENKLSTELSKLGINQKNVLRWHNEEKINYEDRTGRISHYTSASDLANLSGSGSLSDGFFGTVLIKDEMTPWEVYQETRRWTTIEPLAPQGLVAEGIHGQIPRLDQLIGFSMGLENTTKSSDTPPTLDEFQDRMKTMCEKVQCTNTTAPFGIPTDVGRTDGESSSIMMGSCKERTTYVTKREAREPLHHHSNILSNKIKNKVQI